MSSRKIVEYRIVESDFGTNIHIKINELLKSGWSLHGNLISHNNKLIQAMVKYEETIAPPLPTAQSLLPVPPQNSVVYSVSKQSFDYSIPSAEEVAKEFAKSILFTAEEIKLMQDTCKSLFKVIEGSEISTNYKGKKSIYIHDMNNKIKNHLRSLGYEFSPVDSFRNEEYVHFYLR